MKETNIKAKQQINSMRCVSHDPASHVFISIIIETNQRICNKMDHLIHFKTLLSTTDLFCTFGISKLIAVLFFVIIFFGQNSVINLANEFKILD